MIAGTVYEYVRLQRHRTKKDEYTSPESENNILNFIPEEKEQRNDG